MDRACTIEDIDKVTALPRSGSSNRAMRQFGEIYPSECDTVVDHSNAVSVLAHEFSEELKSEIGVELEPAGCHPDGHIP
uniref:Uncharacterized protein n=1 Tax=Candidatus Kentrum sp. TC TaxID=2126339 RepID=A0A451AF95_9GAMM|nr:MAG: hypothetical protein BECKTC1821F_GA0114240_11403 [Candidatus Kentron sp. TC]